MGMRKRVVLSLGLLTVLGVLGLVGVRWLAMARQRISRECFEQIQLGMTMPEVEALLGLPTGNYSRSPALGDYGSYDPPASAREWLADDLAILINFDEQGRVANKRTGGVMRTRDSLLDRLRRWLHL